MWQQSNEKGFWFDLVDTHYISFVSGGVGESAQSVLMRYLIANPNDSVEIDPHSPVDADEHSRLLLIANAHNHAIEFPDSEGNESEEHFLRYLTDYPERAASLVMGYLRKHPDEILRLKGLVMVVSAHCEACEILEAEKKNKR